MGLILLVGFWALLSSFFSIFDYYIFFGLLLCLEEDKFLEKGMSDSRLK